MIRDRLQGSSLAACRPLVVQYSGSILEHNYSAVRKLSLIGADTSSQSSHLGRFATQSDLLWLKKSKCDKQMYPDHCQGGDKSGVSSWVWVSPNNCYLGRGVRNIYQATQVALEGLHNQTSLAITWALA